MSKPSAHAIMALFDALSILALYYVFQEWGDIHHLVEVGADRISYQSRFSLLILSVCMPIIHLLSFVKFEKHQALGNGLLIGLLFGLIAIALYLDDQIEKTLIENSYMDCVNLEIPMTFSRFKTYMKPELQCRESTGD